MEAQARTLESRLIPLLVWVINVSWCLFVFARNDVWFGYQFAFCAVALAALGYAVKTQAWTFLAVASGVAFAAFVMGR